MKVKLPFPRYTRKGECNRCGWCCIQEEPPCPHLKLDERGATCLIYDESDRPDKCKIYPGNPPIKHEGCGYFFFDEWEKRNIKYGDKL